MPKPRPRARRGRLLRLIAVPAFVAGAALGANFAVQVARKPTELLRFAAGGEALSEAGLWERYGPLFRAHATEDMTPEFLAALAYTESSGDGLAAPAWRFSWRDRDWTRVYAPPSSAVGLMQFTEETFRRYRRFCVHRGRVAEARPWYDPRGCWFTALSTRLSPSHSIEVTAAYLQHLAGRMAGGATRAQRQRLGAAIHLCGPSAGGRLVDARFRLEALGLCGGQPAARYVRRVEALRDRFALLAGR